MMITEWLTQCVNSMSVSCVQCMLHLHIYAATVRPSLPELLVTQVYQYSRPLVISTILNTFSFSSVRITKIFG